MWFTVEKMQRCANKVEIRKQDGAHTF